MYERPEQAQMEVLSQPDNMEMLVGDGANGDQLVGLRFSKQGSAKLAEQSGTHNLGLIILRLNHVL